MPELGADQARIVLYRKSTILPGMMLQPSIMLDGEKVGHSRPRGFFYVDVPAGHHEISVHTEVDRSLSLTVQPGETKYVRMTLGIGLVVGRMVPELVDPKVAKRELRRLRYAGQSETGNDEAASDVAAPEAEPSSDVPAPEAEPSASKQKN